MPDEDENASSPPRTLSHQDIVSENIQSKMDFHKFGRPKGQALSVFREEFSDCISKDVHESVAH